MKERRIYIAPAVYWLASSAPWLHRLARPPWRLVKHLLSINADQGRETGYFQEVVRLARQYVPAGTRVIDVGASDSELLSRLDWFPHRTAVDLHYAAQPRGIERVVMDFMDYRPTGACDLVVCLEVLEHLDDPAAFAQKLLRTGATVIVSVPYRWLAGACPTHRQDPVDEAKLQRWTGRGPLEARVVSNGVQRLIAVYRGDAPPARAHGR